MNKMQASVLPKMQIQTTLSNLAFVFKLIIICTSVAYWDVISTVVDQINMFKWYFAIVLFECCHGALKIDLST